MRKMRTIKEVTSELVQSSRRLATWSKAYEEKKWDDQTQVFLFDIRDYLAMFVLLDDRAPIALEQSSDLDSHKLLQEQAALLREWLMLSQEDNGEVRRMKSSVAGILEFNQMLQKEHPTLNESLLVEQKAKNATKSFWQRLFTR